MRGRVFILSFLNLALLAGLTQPALLGLVLATPPTPAPAEIVVWSSPTASPSPTTDPFAHLPTATPVGGRALAVVSQPLPSPSLAELPPTFTPTNLNTTPASTPTARTQLLPNNVVTFDPAATKPTLSPATPANTSPDFLRIARLKLDAPIVPVGFSPSAAGEAVYAWDVPAWRAAGWLNRSAPFGQPGNTVLAGHHNIDGEVFRDLWTLQAGDEISLEADGQQRRYRVAEVLILPDRDQPLAVRLENARHIEPTDDERLTLITCWPYDDNSHRVVVVAWPEAS